MNLILDFEQIVKRHNSPKTDKNKLPLKEKEKSNKFTFREKLYKSDHKYHNFLEKVSKLLKEELTEEETKEEKEKEIHSEEEDEPFKNKKKKRKSTVKKKMSLLKI